MVRSLSLESKDYNWGRGRKCKKMVLENFPFSAAVGTPAFFGFVGLFITAAIFRRPYIAIAGAILGVLLGMGIGAA